MFLDDNYKVLQENIDKNDIVFIFDYEIFENELDLALYYNKYDGGGVTSYTQIIQFTQQ